MPTPLWTRTAQLALLGMTASCAATPQPSVSPPRLVLPHEAVTPCTLPGLPDEPTWADLEMAYAERGASLVDCDGARRLAVETLVAERALQDRWRLDQESRSGRKPAS